jgi:hypothetical protein
MVTAVKGGKREREGMMWPTPLGVEGGEASSWRWRPTRKVGRD